MQLFYSTTDKAVAEYLASLVAGGTFYEFQYPNTETIYYEVSCFLSVHGDNISSAIQKMYRHFQQ